MVFKVRSWGDKLRELICCNTVVDYYSPQCRPIVQLSIFNETQSVEVNSLHYLPTMKGKPLCFCLEVNSSIVQGYVELHEQPMKLLEKLHCKCCYKFSSWDLFLFWFSNVMGLYAFGFLKFYTFIIRYIWLHDDCYQYTNIHFNFSHKFSHSFTIFHNSSPFFDNVIRTYTLLLFMLWEPFPSDAHYAHLPRLVNHKSTHTVHLRTYIPSYLLKC